MHECLVMQAFLLNETTVRKDKFLYYEGKARVHVHCSSSTRNGMISFHRLPELNTHATVSLMKTKRRNINFILRS